MRDLMDIVGTAQLDEAVGQSLLYHGTDPQAAEAILHTNRLEAYTEHTAHHLVPNTRGTGMKGFDLGFKDAEKHGYRHDLVRGVSFTRNVRFARKWKSGEGVVFVFDRTKITQRHRLVKVDYFGASAGREPGSEAEEFLPGKLINVDDYLVGIEMSQKTFDDLTEQDDNFPEDYDKPFLTLLRHPLLTVDGHRWDGFTGVRKNPDQA